MGDLHVVDGDSAAAALRHAIITGKLSGEVFSLNDALAIGPLSSSAERLAFQRSMIVVPPHAQDEVFSFDEDHDVFARWDALRMRCQIPGRVLLWISGNASDHVLLRMACHTLQGTRAALWHVPVPAFEDGFEAVAAHSPDALARFAPRARPLSPGTVATLALEFADIAAHPEPVRHLEADGRLRYLPIDLHDARLLECCPTHWTPANRVVGDTMVRCDRRNGLGDYFFAARLRMLIDAGQVQCRTHPLPAWWDWRTKVRRVIAAG